MHNVKLFIINVKTQMNMRRRSCSVQGLGSVTGFKDVNPQKHFD